MISYPPSPHTHTPTHPPTQIYSVFQVQFLQDSVTVNESATASSVNISLNVQILIAQFDILQSNVTVNVSLMSGGNATGIAVTYSLANKTNQTSI